MENLGLRISANIRKAMKEKKIKNYELAAKLGKTKENLSMFFSRLEKGGGSNTRVLNEIAEALEVPLSIFFE
ncbi:helix-turn-helix domain-containing protein [Fusobacterium varium]